MKELRFQTIVCGTGAAGYACAHQLHRLGCENTAIITESRTWGTSRNTGSDKQTYYKLTLTGDTPDSVTQMAATLFEGKAVDGDIALAEAAGSVPAFLRLVEMGVPFPTNAYGEYVGYKTDHDPAARATSVGPLTSHFMTEALEKTVLAENTTLLDDMQLVRILTHAGKLYGVLCLDRKSGEFVLIHTVSLVLATGGPAALYADSVYPESQHGASGIAFMAGIAGRNLTEWQYGLASVRPRWNVSGTYMQVLPRVISTEKDGSDPREFLSEAFPDRSEMLGRLFRKGYEWPFDSRKALGGSSLIDILVYRETVEKGRRVFLDYRTNPLGKALRLTDLPEDASTYLRKGLSLGPAADTMGTPFERLCRMNRPAVEFYRSKGVDLAAEPLEIALSAQHNNGGLAVDNWWRTGVEGVFAIGECAATHGVYRPGGSALNSGQVGACRAAEYIARHRSRLPIPDVFPGSCKGSLKEAVMIAQQTTQKKSSAPAGAPFFGSLKSAAPGNNAPAEDLPKMTTAQAAAHFRSLMSRSGASFREAGALREALRETEDFLASFRNRVTAEDTPAGLSMVFRLQDQLYAMKIYLTAMVDYAEHTSVSRGSALYYAPGGSLPSSDASAPALPEHFRFLPDNHAQDGLIQEILPGKAPVWRPVHPMPDRSADFFEPVWAAYRENGGVPETPWPHFGE